MPPLTSFFRSLLKRFRPPARSVARVGACPDAGRDPRPRGSQSRATAEHPISPEQFRDFLIEALDDPVFARLLARRLLLPTFPIHGGTCTAAEDITPGNFGTNCGSGDFAFLNRKLGIGTTSPLFALDLRAAGVSSEGDSNVVAALFNSATFGAGVGGSLKLGGTFNSGGSLAGYAGIAGIKENATEGNYASALTLSTRANGANLTERMRIDSGGNVGIGTTSPDAKLHVKGGGITIGDSLGAGRLGFAETNESDARIVLYRGGRPCNADPPGSPDITILRNFPNYDVETDDCVRYTLLRVWAPKITASAPSDDREATISLVRDLNSTDDNSQEFIDLYNNGYASETQHGIRIQKRTGTTTALYRDFVFDKFSGSGSKVKLLVINTDAGNVVVGDKATAGAKLDVFGGDIYVSSPGNGIILKSPDGTKCARISLNNSGVLITTAVTCP